ncbi:MAG: hypothetical protein HY909_01865 [Deltaproteobacteria bacterium]|nr:hypothetical protein [Deltaproteobacteria bacterium]
MLAPRARSLGDAIALGPWALARAQETRAPCLASSVVRGPAAVLGALQRAPRVLAPARCEAAGVAMYRRETTGTAVYLGGRALVWTLALPAVTALAPDATMATALNRNVRGFLQGLTRVGALAHYFGREWVSVGHRPAAVLGLDATPEGAVLLELWAGWDEPVALPDALVTDDERAVDRWRGKTPRALEGACGGRSPEAVGAAVATAVAARAGLTPTDEPAPERALRAVQPIDFTKEIGGVWRALRVPIGWVEVGATEGGARALRGDVLTARWALEALARSGAVAPGAPLEGARWEDLRALLEGAP